MNDQFLRMMAACMVITSVWFSSPRFSFLNFGVQYEIALIGDTLLIIAEAALAAWLLFGGTD